LYKHMEGKVSSEALKPWLHLSEESQNVFHQIQCTAENMAIGQGLRDYLPMTWKNTHHEAKAYMEQEFADALTERETEHQKNNDLILESLFLMHVTPLAQKLRDRQYKPAEYVLKMLRGVAQASQKVFFGHAYGTLPEGEGTVLRDLTEKT